MGKSDQEKHAACDACLPAWIMFHGGKGPVDIESIAQPTLTLMCQLFTYCPIRCACAQESRHFLCMHADVYVRVYLCALFYRLLSF